MHRESQLGFADIRVSDRPKSCSVFHSPQECWGRSSALQVITDAKIVIIDQPEGFLIWHIGHLWILFWGKEIFLCVAWLLYSGLWAFQKRGAVMVIAGVTESLAVPGLSRLYRHHQQQQKYCSAWGPVWLRKSPDCIENSSYGKETPAHSRRLSLRNSSKFSPVEK